MAKYRKKPIIVNAEKYFDGLEDGFINGTPYIKTLEGPLLISKGDYIITGIKGEKYPCKPDIFNKTYVPCD